LGNKVSFKSTTDIAESVSSSTEEDSDDEDSRNIKVKTKKIRKLNTQPVVSDKSNQAVSQTSSNRQLVCYNCNGLGHFASTSAAMGLLQK
jgi:hypothetical protein